MYEQKEVMMDIATIGIVIISTALMAAGGWIVAYRLGYKHGYDNGVWDAYYKGRARK